MIRNLIFAMLVGLMPALVHAAQLYTVTDLGTLGGTTSFGTALNDSGHAVGYSTLPGGATHGFYWTPGGGMQDLGLIGTGMSQAFDISNSNDVVGQSGGKAFRWTLGTGMVLIDSASNGSANGINNSNVAIGSRAVAASNRTLRWSAANAITVISPFGDTAGAAINDLGQAVGVVSGLSGYYNNGTTLTGLGAFLPADLNDTREIVGALSGIAAVFNFDSKITTSLGKLSPADTSSTALGINQAGVIVGVSAGSGAFVTDSPSTIVSLTSLLAPSYTGWDILTATDINNVGQIIGVGQFNGQSHAVILTPVPEPSTLALLFVAFGSLAALARRVNCRRGH